MAEQGFGVKDVNVIGGTGTPTIQSPNNLNLNANTVAISTHVTVGGTLQILSAGTPKIESPSTLNLNAVTVAISTNATVGGILTATSLSGGGNDIVTTRWTIGANGSSDYTFTGPGGLSATNDPKIYLARGQTYEFVMNTGGGHPFQIQTSGGAAYNTGVTNNGASSGTIKFEVPFDAPNSLQYKCTSHSSMGNTIIVYPDLSP